MVPVRLKHAAPAAVALLLLVAAPGGALPLRDPGPFYPLALGHRGAAYRDALPSGATYRLVSGRLPGGVSVATNGAVSGTPSETGSFKATLSARESNGRSYEVRVAIDVRKPDDTDLARVSPSFLGAGTYQTTVDNLLVDLEDTFDGHRLRTRIRVVRPRGLSGPAPLLLFHRGRGFDEDDYTQFHQHIASYGIAVASVEDAYSFSGQTFRGENTQYDLYRAELGMLSASGVVEAAADYLLDRAADPQDAYYRAFSGEDLFMAGHSRGGGATHASHQRSFELRLKGLIYLMAFDLRYFQEVAPPATSPAYPIFAENPRTPSLVIAAENDGDLSYPIADQFIDRATGPTTQVSIYGGVHNLISDSHSAEGNARITRREEQTRVADWIVCFIKRWSGAGDASLEWRLYGGAQDGSGTVGVTGWRPTDRTVVLEDAQDADADRNLLGPNYVASTRRREASLYPAVGDLPRLGLKHQLTPTASVAAFRMATDAALDVSAHTRVVFRCAQTSRYGWSGTGLWLRLVDDAGGVSWLRVSEPGSAGLLPTYDGLSPHQRFVDVHADLSAFYASGGPAADLHRVRALDVFVTVRDASRSGTVVLDAVRFE